MQLNVGDFASIKRIIKSEDILEFARVSNDFNPIHLDDEYAKNTLFKNRIAHGMLVSSMISALIANKLPGPGAIYLSQELRFKAPVFVDDEITAKAEVIEIIKPTLYKLRTTCEKQDGTIAIEGVAVIKFG